MIVSSPWIVTADVEKAITAFNNGKTVVFDVKMNIPDTPLKSGCNAVAVAVDPNSKVIYGYFQTILGAPLSLIGFNGSTNSIMTFEE